jgi:hypothetical protein
MTASPPGGCTFARRPDHRPGTDFVAWRANCDPAVVAVEANPAPSDALHSFDLAHLACPVLVLRDVSGAEYLLIGDGTGQIRLDVTAGTVLQGPVRFRYELAGTVGVESKLLTLHRLITLLRLRRFPRGFFPSRQRGRRWMMALRAFDARRAGATHREIAVALFGEAAVAADWDGSSAYLRCPVQRLIHLGETLVRGDYRRLLR